MPELVFPLSSSRPSCFSPFSYLCCSRQAAVRQNWGCFPVDVRAWRDVDHCLRFAPVGTEAHSAGKLGSITCEIQA